MWKVGKSQHCTRNSDNILQDILVCKTPMLLFYPFIYGKMIVWKMMMSKLFKLTTLAVAMTSALFSTTIFAQETVEVHTLDPIVVTASKTEQNASQVPARVNVIDKKTIEQNPALNLSDVLRNDASVSIKQSGGIGQVPEVSLRGSKAVHTLFLRDGARLNTQNDLGVAWTGFYDVNDIERIEVLKGPASVQYGSDAVSGVVQMISQKPQKTGAFVTGIYGENDTYKAIVGADVAQNGFYAQLRGQRMETDGTRIFDTQPKNQKASYDQKGYSAKIGYDNQQNLDVSVSMNHNEGTNIFSADNGTTNTAPRHFENQVINTQAKYNVNQNVAVSARYSHIEDKQNVPAYGSQYNTEAHEADVNAQINFASNQNVLVGTTFNTSEYESNTITNGTQDIDTIGYYVQHQYNTDKINAQLGVRVEDNERFGTHTVGQGSVRYHFTPTTSVYTNIGSAFRAPTLNEMYTQWGGNPNLKPEESLTYELGLDQKIGENTAINVSAYRTNVKNLITSVNLGNWVYENQNVDKATFTGGELGFKWAKNDYFASAQYAYVKTENKATGLELAYRPQHTGVVTLGYDDGQYGVNTTFTARSKANTSNSNNLVKLPSYTTVDVNFHFNINPHVTLFGNVNNLFDENYKTVANWTGNWYINGGRQANIGATFRY